MRRRSYRLMRRSFSDRQVSMSSATLMSSWTDCEAVRVKFGVAAVTVSVVDPLMEPDAAVMVVVPAATPVASPPLLMVATVVTLEVHVAGQAQQVAASKGGRQKDGVLKRDLRRGDHRLVGLERLAEQLAACGAWR